LSETVSAVIKIIFCGVVNHVRGAQLHVFVMFQLNKACLSSLNSSFCDKISKS